MKYCFEEKKKMVSIAATVMFIGVTGIIFLASDRAGSDAKSHIVSSTDYKEDISNLQDDVTVSDEKSESTVPVEEIVVHICGAVKNPGVYTVEKNARLTDVIDVAGGFCENAAKDYHNLAECVTDGQKIVIYTKKQIKKNKEKNVQENSESGRSSIVNINSASKEELMNIPGIGESKANDIISYREKNGAFKDTKEIMNIPGIKEGIYSKISDMITV